MTETYLQQLQKARKERLRRFEKAAITNTVSKPEPAPATNEIATNPEEEILLRERVAFKDILKEVCRYYNVSMLDVISARRTFKIALARHVVAYISNQHTALSTPQIASRLGGRDRATITHAIQRMRELSKTDKIAADITEIKARLQI